MNMGRPSLAFGFFFAILLLLPFSSLVSAQEVENQKEFDYVEGSGKGPDQWGELHEEWALCNDGELQSPIDLLNRRVEVVPKLGDLKISYKPSNATLKNRGHDIMLQWDGDAGYIEINGTKYMLKQCHWHSPSEHTIDGKRFALEAHLVHSTQDNKTAVIGILYNIGRPDSFLSELEETIRSIADNKTEEKVGVVDPRHLRFDGGKYYRYLGSLTTPPCTEGVVWTVNKKVMSVSLRQVKLLRMAVHDNAENNARPLQPLNQRPIYLYIPRDKRI